MVTLKKYQNKKIAIYGMGITGFSAARVFKRSKATIYCWDDNKKARKKAKSSNFNIQKFWLKNVSVEKIIMSPGININKCKIKNYLKKNADKIITDLDLFFELNKDSLIISITGTNGKSTTCKVIEKILKTANLHVKTVGNIGNPILLSSKIKKRTIFIIEVSSYQLEYSNLFRSRYAAILNISPDHLERHKSINNYIKTKSKIFHGQKSTDYSYINFNNKYSKKIKKIFKKNKLKSKLVSVKAHKYNFLLKKIKNNYFNGKGNIQNLVFAYKIAKKLKIKDDVIIKALNKFKGLSHRQEIIFSNKKLLYINDSKATSFDASLQCLLNYNKIYWIVGGLPKHKDFFDLKKVKKKIIKAYIIGKHPLFFENQIKNHIAYTISGNIKKALEDISKDLTLNQNIKKTIILSPAAASFDQFKNFESRGVFFKNLINKKYKKRSNA